MKRPVDEKGHPYIGKLEGTDFSYSDLSEQAEYHVQNILYLANDVNRETFVKQTKNAVYNYGAAEIYMQTSYSYLTPDYKNQYVDEASDNYNHQYTNSPYGTSEFFISNQPMAVSEKFVNENDTQELLSAVSFVLESEGERVDMGAEGVFADVCAYTCDVENPGYEISTYS